MIKEKTSGLRTSAILTGTFKGSPFERGRQQGERYGERVRRSRIMEFYRDYCIRHCGGGVLRMEAIELLHHYFAARLSPEAKALVKGFSSASGVDAWGAAQAAVMPDLMNYLIGLMGRLALPAAAGCTSVAAWGDHTPGGRLLYGRNLDFPGGGLFDRSPLVCRHEPDSGLRHVTVSTAGTVVDGITGINEAGLTLALHQHINTNVSRMPAGRCVLDLGRHILERAATIEEAAAMAAAARPASGWTLVLTHWKQKRAAALELTPKGMALIEAQGTRFVRANTFEDPGLRAREIDSPSFRESSRLRRARAETLLEQSRGRVDAGVIAAILGDHFEPERKLARAFTQTIAQAHNMTSVVFDPEQGVLWLAEGVAPVCDSAYRKVALWSDEPAGEVLAARADPLSKDQRHAVQSYQTAMRSWELSSDARGAAEALAGAARQDPQDPAYRLMHGLFALKSGEPAAAAESLEAGAALPDIAHRAQVQKLWQARALDLSGGRARSVVLYREVARTSLVRELRRAAAEGVEKRYKGGEIRPDLFHFDTYGY